LGRKIIRKRRKCFRRKRMS